MLETAVRTVSTRLPVPAAQPLATPATLGMQLASRGVATGQRDVGAANVFLMPDRAPRKGLRVRRRFYGASVANCGPLSWGPSSACELVLLFHSCCMKSMHCVNALTTRVNAYASGCLDDHRRSPGSPPYLWSELGGQVDHCVLSRRRLSSA
jgi:hypothetical protein